MDSSQAAEEAKAEANISFKGMPCRQTDPELSQHVPNRSGHWLFGKVRSSPLSSFTCAEKHYALAVAGYSRAIDLDPENAVYYANRAAAHVRLENFGLALSDATKAIELKPAYVKVRVHFAFR